MLAQQCRSVSGEAEGINKLFIVKLPLKLPDGGFIQDSHVLKQLGSILLPR
jgi:hypothetical protein